MIPKATVPERISFIVFHYEHVLIDEIFYFLCFLILQENYDWRVIECLTPFGEIQPHHYVDTQWLFSPLEAKCYQVKQSSLQHLNSMDDLF